MDMETTKPAQSGIIYNVTTKVDTAFAQRWVQWTREIHIPGMLATGCFTHTVFLRLVDVDDTDGPTYAVQYHCADKAHYEQYMAEYAATMRKQTVDTWGENVLSFRSVLEIVN